MKPVLLAPVLFALLVGCGAPPPCPGGNCPDVGCPAGGCTDAGVCADATRPGNVLVNPSFECGDPVSGWHAQNGAVQLETSRARSGKRAAKLVANASVASSLWHSADAVLSPGTKTFCARAHVRGTATNGRLTVVRVRKTEIFPVTFSIPVTTEWEAIPPSAPLSVTAENDDKLLLRVWIPDARAGDELVIDDVALWESTSGRCEDG